MLRTLPVKSLVRFSKPWNQLITDPFLVSSNLQFNKQSPFSSSSCPDSHTLLGITKHRDYYGKYHEQQQFEYFRIDNTKKTTLEHLKIKFPWTTKFKPKIGPPTLTYKEEDVRIIGHCNGLVCILHSQTLWDTSSKDRIIRHFKLDRYIISNPVTGKFKILPQSDIQIPDLTFVDDPRTKNDKNEKLVAIGFGVINDSFYKVVRVTYGMGRFWVRGSRDISQYIPYDQPWVEVYDSRFGSWRRVLVDLGFPYDYLHGGVHNSKFSSGCVQEGRLHGALYNCYDGCLYWLGRGYGERSRYSILVSFDLGQEKMSETLLPHKCRYDLPQEGRCAEMDCDDELGDVFGRYGTCLGIGMLGRSVAMIVGDQRNTLVFSVWKMDKDEESNKISWTHMYRLNVDGSPKGFCRNGELLLKLAGAEEENWRKLHVYDSKRMNDACFGFTDLGFRVGNVVPDFVESLEWLDGGNGSD